MKEPQGIGWAVAQMQSGLRVRRSGWNAKGMHLYMEDMFVFPVKAGAFSGMDRKYDPCIVLFTAQGTHQPGWVCSQADLLATDWALVE